MGVFSIRAVSIWSVTWTLLLRHRVSACELPTLPDEMRCVPYPLAIDVAGRLLLEEAAHFLDLGAARLGVEQQVAELARVGLDVNGALGGPRVAFQHQDLVLGPALLLDGIHDARRNGHGRPDDPRSMRVGAGKAQRRAWNNSRVSPLLRRLIRQEASPHRKV